MKRMPVIKLVLSMVIFGSIGAFVRWLDVGRGMLAMLRGLLGGAVILAFMLLRKKRPDPVAIKKNLPLLIISGAAMGFNWILLFEAYSHTTVAIATLCYYMAPVFVMLGTPLVTGERLGVVKILCISVSLVGMVAVSGVLDAGIGAGSLLGIILSLGAALLYASVTLVSKRLRDISAEDTTVCQLLIAALVLAPYSFIFEDNGTASLGGAAIPLIITVGVLHTGIAYLLYFSSVKELSAQTVAVLSYLDPIVAIAASTLLLGESAAPSVFVGAALILISTLVSELYRGKYR